MMIKLIVLVFLCTSLSPPLVAKAQVADPDRPDLTNWDVYSASKIKISDKVPYYLGFDMIYQNPNNKKEYVRQIRTFIPFILVKSRAIQDKNYIDTIISYTTDTAERDLLKSYLVKSDPILYIRWKVQDDFERDTLKLDNRDGENEVWLWNAFGEWIYARNVKVKISYPSETFTDLNNELFIVGIKYSLSRTVYHSREVPYAFISIAVKA